MEVCLESFRSCLEGMYVTPAHTPLSRTQCCDLPSCKGGLEIPLLVWTSQSQAFQPLSPCSKMLQLVPLKGDA
jgi:hypothetical protein